MKVEQFEHANQFRIFGEGKEIFQSYESTIAIISENGKKLELGTDWDYSKTTLRHLYNFLDQYFKNFELKEKIFNSKNKKQTIQKLIDEKLINYNVNL